MWVSTQRGWRGCSSGWRACTPAAGAFSGERRRVRSCDDALEAPIRERYRRVEGQQLLRGVDEHVVDKVEGEHVLHHGVGKPECALVGWRFVSAAWRCVRG